jgi:hypothetical protein
LTIKNLVKIKDYHSFLLQESSIWTGVKTRLLKERNTLLENNSKQIQEVERKYFAGFSYKEQKLKQPTETEEIKELNHKLSLIEQHLKALENEWNRTEYYLVYQFEMIEIQPELSNMFFDYAMQEMKSTRNYN